MIGLTGVRSWGAIGLTAVAMALLGCVSAPLWAGSTGTSSPSSDPSWRTAQANNIYEATFRAMFGKNNSAMSQMTDAYYIVMPVGDGMGDPTSAFLARFAKDTPVVKKGSACSTRGVITEPGSGEPGILFFVEDITWMKNDEVSVEGGYEEDVATAARVTCQLQYKHDHWKLIKETERLPRQVQRGSG